MLQIKTTSGETLIHADQRPDTYNGRSYDGSQYMVHAGEWGHHKYIRKEGNRYIYPEDLQKKAQAGVQRVKQKTKEIYDDRKIYGDAAKNMASDGAKVGKQVAKALWDSSKIGKIYNQGYQVGQEIANHQNSKKDEAQVTRSGETKQNARPTGRKRKVLEGGMEIKKGNKTSTGPVGWNGRTADDINHIGADVAKRRDKRISQTVNAHQGVVANEERLKNHETTAELERQKQKTAARKMAKEQQKSAHAGYESDKKKFPEGGSTEELELQKRKTASRKARKESIEAIKRANKEESQIRSAHQGDVNRPAGDHKTMMLEYQINKKKRNDDLEAKKAKQKSEYTQEVSQQNAEYKKKRKQMDDEFQQESNQMQSDYNKKVAQSKMDYARRKRAMQDRQEQYEKEYIKKHPIKGRALKTGSYYLNKYVKEKRR